MPPIFAYPRHVLKPFKKGGMLAFKSMSPAMRQRLSRTPSAPDLDVLTQRIILPSLPVADEDLAQLQHWQTGRSLARQDDWDRLADKIILADDARLSTPGGADEATLLALGAQSDALAVVVDTLADGGTPDPTGIETLEAVAQDYHDNHAVVLVVALAHMNMGRAWLAASSEMAQLVSPHRTHFKRAKALLDPFDAFDLDAPSLAAVEAALAEILCADLACIQAAYDRLLDIYPESPVHIRAYGRAVLHELAYDSKLLIRLSEAVSARTDDVTDEGAYVWLHLDVLGQSDAALAELDTDRFSRGLRALAETRKDQHLINQLTAFCAIDMAPRTEEDNRTLARKRAALHDNLDWLLSDHLAELHPMLWSQTQAYSVLTPRDKAPRALVAQGRQNALRVIARRFADQLADGSTLAFSPAGMYRLPSM
ncbi:MAG: hypothetical protein AB8B82_15860 [Roseovarius sp.]